MIVSSTLAVGWAWLPVDALLPASVSSRAAMEFNSSKVLESSMAVRCRCARTGGRAFAVIGFVAFIAFSGDILAVR